MLAVMAGADTNQFGWPIDIKANLALIDEIIQEVPHKLPQRAPSLGAFIVALSDDVPAATEGPRRNLRGNREMTWEEKTAANHERMAAIEILLVEQQESSGTDFCSQVVRKFASSNMMLVLTSPRCTKWLAKRTEVELLEVDGDVHAYNSVAVSTDEDANAGASALDVDINPNLTTAASLDVDAGSISPSTNTSTNADADASTAASELSEDDPRGVVTRHADEETLSTNTSTNAGADASAAASELSEDDPRGVVTRRLQ
jgi:hypothetical protein